MVHAALDRALAAEPPGEFDGRFVVPMGTVATGLAAREAEVLARIDRPMPMQAALATRLDFAALERLVARGLVMISGVTPSDAAHVLGWLDAWDGAAAEKGLSLMARRRTGAGERIAADAEGLARAITDRLTAQTVDGLLEAAFAEDPDFAGEDPAALTRSRMAVVGLQRRAGLVDVSLRLAVPVIGLGASAPVYYPAVGKVLGCEMILPEHAGVANAIGAVVGQVSERASGVVTCPSEGRFIAHLPDGPETFADRDAALQALEAGLRVEAAARAQAAGAEELTLTAEREFREAEVEGRKIFIEARLSVTATGRPAVAITRRSD